MDCLPVSTFVGLGLGRSFRQFCGLLRLLYHLTQSNVAFFGTGEFYLPILILSAPKLRLVTQDEGLWNRVL